MTDKSRLAALAAAMSAWMADAGLARAMKLTAATLVAVALLAGTAGGGKKQKMGSRAFVAQTTCGAGIGSIEWGEDVLRVDGEVQDKAKDGYPNSKTHLYVKWKDKKGPHNVRIDGATANNGETIDFKRFDVPGVTGTPRDAEVSACSDSCGKRWACGRPG